MGDRKAFFYGTLMAPAVLHRVCHGDPHPPPSSWQKQSLTIRPAILRNHRRHRVRYADYPAIVPTSPSEASTVRGTFVSGLTDGDIWRLDIFEGSEYARKRVKVRLLSAPSSHSSDSRTAHASNSAHSHQPSSSNSKAPLANSSPVYHEEMVESGEDIEAETYIWRGPRDALEDQEWDFEEFTREKMWRWVGQDSYEEYSEVDEAVAAAEGKDPTGGRATNGSITRELEKKGIKQQELLRNAV